MGISLEIVVSLPTYFDISHKADARSALK